LEQGILTCRCARAISIVIHSEWSVPSFAWIYFARLSTEFIAHNPDLTYSESLLRESLVLPERGGFGRITFICKSLMALQWSVIVYRHPGLFIFSISSFFTGFSSFCWRAGEAQGFEGRGETRTETKFSTTSTYA